MSLPSSNPNQSTPNPDAGASNEIMYTTLLNALKRDLRKDIEEWIDTRIIENLHTISISVMNAVFNNVPGDYLEFGAYGGFTFRMAAKTYRENTQQLLSHSGMKQKQTGYLPPPMRFFAFDAFEKGLPEGKGIDGDDLRPVHWSGGSMAFSAEKFVERCLESGMAPDSFMAIPGYFQDTLNEETRKALNLTKAAVIHIDCDLYESTVTALDFCTPLMQMGTYVVFDDWFRYRGSENHGEFRAFKEWRERNPNFTFREIARWKGSAIAYLCSGV